MSDVRCAPVSGCALGENGVSLLRGRLRSLSYEATSVDAAVTTCLVWVAGVLVGVAGGIADARSAGALVHEASAVLAEVPAPSGHTKPSLPAPHLLTDRQLAVLRQLQEEIPLRQIAERMYVSYNTIKSHTRAVYHKLGVCSRAEAVARARELGLVQR